MSAVRRDSDAGAKIDLTVRMPIVEGKMGCFCWRTINYDSVVYDEKQKSLVAKNSGHMNEEEKEKTKKIFAQFIRNRVNYDEKSYYIISKFIAFDEQSNKTIYLKQVDALRKLLEGMEEFSSRKSSQEDAEENSKVLEIIENRDIDKKTT